MRCLGDEVLNYSETVKGTKCLLCPFRQFRSPGRLKAHIKRHRKEYMFLADGKTKQLAVAKAYFNYRSSITSISPFDVSNVGLLRKPAELNME